MKEEKMQTAVFLMNLLSLYPLFNGMHNLARDLTFSSILITKKNEFSKPKILL